jgi:hypothetical protein
MTGGMKGIREPVARSFWGKSGIGGKGGRDNRHGGETKTVEKPRSTRIGKDKGMLRKKIVDEKNEIEIFF